MEQTDINAKRIRLAVVQLFIVKKNVTDRKTKICERCSALASKNLNKKESDVFIKIGQADDHLPALNFENQTY